MKYGLLILLVIVSVIFGPLLLIWSLNALFPALAIPFTLKTWAAAFVIGAYFSASSQSFK